MNPATAFLMMGLSRSHRRLAVGWLTPKVAPATA